MAAKIKVIVTGALGKMGTETLKAVWADEGLELVGAIDSRARGEMLTDIIGIKDTDMKVENDLDYIIVDRKPQVMIDFTNPQAVFNNTRTALKNGVSCVVGTTGLNEVELKQLEKLAAENNTGVAIIPNFAIGAVLMMKFAREAAKFFPDVEIIELHHDQKMDAPSGTALKTAEMISENRGQRPPKNIREFEKVAGCRGGEVEQVRIHSIRLPGMIAHQEVIFGSPGQSLKIRHDSMDRAAFMPGVVMVVKEIINRKGLIYGMENLI
ncbi:4-hydroxy-tetrahydrodipicolinate reductase [Syntrophomonas palmitatica]|uniref:4-hydroxy-tetrahydrodipicolinate reductase n=1 Tax=Syntrophomonas palmitatica TaxID=402877 RepID=UPI0006D0D3F0|nr:4-hydroxy-tetrahydrodipicolinate reductase [Syntrophomonas palmitatica]